jgi:hypothetical protein
MIYAVTDLLVRADRCRNADLQWVPRGGGSFAAVTQFELCTADR